MKIDWSKFKKVRSDEKSTTLRHPAGHEVVVAHKALSRANRRDLDQIPHNYADGGEVEKDNQDEKLGAAQRLNMSEKSLKEIEKYPVPPAQKDDAGDRDLDAAFERNPAEEAPPPLAGRNFADETPLRSDQIDTTQSDDGQANVSMGLTQAVPAPVPSSSLQVAPNDPWGRETQLQGVLGGEQQQEKALQQQAALEGAQGRVKATQELAHGQAIQKLNDNFMATTKAFNENQQHLLKDFEEGHINPNHLFESKSGLGKVTSAIGLILGGMGGAMAGQGNPALDFLNKQIDRDIDAQKANMDKRKTLFAANMQLYGNEKDAYVATKAAMTDLYAHLAASTAAQAAGPLAQARANQLAGALKAQVAPQVGGMLQNQAILKTLSDGAAPGSGNGHGQAMPPETKLRLMSMAGLIPESQLPKVQEELKGAQEYEEKRNNALAAFDTVAKTATLGYKMGSPLRAFSGAESSAMNAAIAEIAKDTTGRYNPEEAHAISEQFVPKLKDTAHDVAVKRQGFINYVNQKGHFPLLKQYGIDIAGSGRHTSGGEKKIKLGPPVK